MCTIIDPKLCRRRGFAAQVVLGNDIPQERLVEIRRWLAVFEHGTSGFCSIEHSVSRYTVEKDAPRARAFDMVSVYSFSDPQTAFAFKMRWG